MRIFSLDSTLFSVIVGVRTFDGAYLISIRIAEEKSDNPVEATFRHRFISGDSGLSRLTDMALSPYNPNEYAVIDDTGRVAFLDCQFGHDSFGNR